MSQLTPPVRVAELMACLSVATDLGMGQPADYAMTTCVVGMRIGEALAFDTATLNDVYYETLLRYVGCNADTYWAASLFGDELAFRAEFVKVDTADMTAMHDGPLVTPSGTLPASGRVGAVEGVLITTLCDGHIVREETYWNVLDLIAQIS